MKLAEALMNRADCQKRVEQLKTRLTRSAKVQEGEHPPENPTDLFHELNDTLNEFESLVTAINRTNSQVLLSTGVTIAEALAQRDTLSMRRSIIQDVINAAAIRQDRFSKSEVKFYSTVPIMDLQKQVDQYSKAFRELDTTIQEANWKTKLL
ncbi:hypothetical protein ASG93_08400 [Paenibacillus sp. Soil787]|nr:hypothetical protein ASG93_08400 [Paenibacillus sp. Soil787]